MKASAVDYSKLSLQAGQLFNPNTPVSVKDLFKGRTKQIVRVMDVIAQKGQHAIIFGERGVGKTSLANVLSEYLNIVPIKTTTVRVNCDKTDTFSSVWLKAFDEMSLVSNKPGIGFKKEVKQSIVSSSSFFAKGNVSPTDVRKALQQLTAIFHPVIILDEFDRLEEDVIKIFADLIKGLSDYAIDATVILIGVGQSVEDIIGEHESLSRALVQVQMPRMKDDEIKEIISNVLEKLGMKISEVLLDRIAKLVNGLPHYAHLIGLHATREALDNETLTVNEDHYQFAVKRALEDAQHSIKAKYHESIRSSRKVSLFEDVLLACALAPISEVGDFPAHALRGAMQEITGKKYEIPAFAQHLNDFSESKRGNILIKLGDKRRFRYKFADPLMQPYIIMQGVVSGKYKEPILKKGK